jgi:hypothetical protein
MLRALMAILSAQGWNVTSLLDARVPIVKLRPGKHQAHHNTSNMHSSSSLSFSSSTSSSSSSVSGTPKKKDASYSSPQRHGHKQVVPILSSPVAFPALPSKPKRMIIGDDGSMTAVVTSTDTKTADTITSTSSTTSTSTSSSTTTTINQVRLPCNCDLVVLAAGSRVAMAAAYHQRKGALLQRYLNYGNGSSTHSSHSNGSGSVINTNVNSGGYRLRQLIMSVKHWARARGVGDARYGTVNSLSWTLMAIQLMQMKHWLPVLTNGEDTTRASSSSSAPLIAPVPVPPIGDVIGAFFHYYATIFDHITMAIDINTGHVIDRVSPSLELSSSSTAAMSMAMAMPVGGSGGSDMALTLKAERQRAVATLLIHDPIESGDNTARAVSKDKWSLVHAELLRAHRLLTIGDVTPVTITSSTTKDTVASTASSSSTPIATTATFDELCRAWPSYSVVYRAARHATVSSGNDINFRSLFA